MNKKIFDKKKV